MSNVIHIDDNNFKEIVQDGVTLVDFHADWCGPCRTMSPAIEQLSAEFNGKAKVAKLNVDAGQNTSMEFGVNSIPTLIVFKNGKEMKRFNGVTHKNDIAAAINSQL